MQADEKRCTLIVPVLNAGPQFQDFIDKVLIQSVRPDEIIVLDSESDDASAKLAEVAGFTVINVPRAEFSHGGTRQIGALAAKSSDILVFLTQDAFLATPDSLQNILEPFSDPTVGAVCGRQLPHMDASAIAKHARLFNYPPTSCSKSKPDIERLGIKAAFMSNSFAAYRRTALMSVGGFPSDVIFGEDTFVSAKMLQAGWTIAYSADATCYHSHNYTFKQEFERYFDIGVFHFREKWFIESLGKPEGEGKRFVLSELRYLSKYAPLSIPSAFFRTFCKLFAYKLGQKEKFIPLRLKSHLSMNKGFFKNV